MVRSEPNKENGMILRFIRRWLQEYRAQTRWEIE